MNEVALLIPLLPDRNIAKEFVSSVSCGGGSRHGRLLRAYRFESSCHGHRFHGDDLLHQCYWLINSTGSHINLDGPEAIKPRRSCGLCWTN